MVMLSSLLSCLQYLSGVKSIDWFKPWARQRERPSWLWTSAIRFYLQSNAMEVNSVLCLLGKSGLTKKRRAGSESVVSCFEMCIELDTYNYTRNSNTSYESNYEL
jgi:hypothetical protein